MNVTLSPSTSPAAGLRIGSVATGPSVRTTTESPIGTIVVESTDDAVTEILLPGPDGAPAALVGPEPRRRPAPLADAVAQLGEYFAGRRTTFELALVTEGTPFQRQVWAALGEIPFGHTVSYAELAAMVGRPTAFRAVGQANGANPLPIVLPCHRVLASGGRIGGYGGGLAMKRTLLALEGVALS